MLHATFDAPPINLIGPEVVRDMVTLLDALYRPSGIRVVVFDSADDDFLFPHVDIAKVAEYTASTGSRAHAADRAIH